MSPWRRPLAWAVAAIAVGGGVLLALRGLGDDAPTPMPESVAAVAPVPAAAPPAPAPRSMGPAPWERAAGNPPAATTTPAPAAAGGPATIPAASDTAAQIAIIREQSQRNVAVVDGLLREIDELERSGKAAPEMRVDALRENLGIARRAQVLALELAESSQQPDSPARRQRTNEILAELQQLQGRLRHDPMPAGLPTAGQAQ